MDFSKANDCIPHGLLRSPQLLLDYLTIWKQRIIIVHLLAHGGSNITNINTDELQQSILDSLIFNPLQNGLFRDCSRMGGWGGGAQKVPLSLQSVIYPTMMRLRTLIPYLKKIQKTYEPRDTTLEISIFFTGNQRNLLHQEIQIYNSFWYIISVFLFFLESLKIVLINMEIWL